MDPMEYGREAEKVEGGRGKGRGRRRSPLPGGKSIVEQGASDFTLAKHNGTVTITRGSRRQTFQVTTVLSGGMKGERLVKVLIGPDPEAFHSWSTFGLVTAGQVQLWKRWDTKTYQGYARLLNDPRHYVQRGYRYEAAIRCRRCNGVLSDEHSRARGLGDMCQAYVKDGEDDLHV